MFLGLCCVDFHWSVVSGAVATFLGFSSHCSQGAGGVVTAVAVWGKRDQDKQYCSIKGWLMTMMHILCCLQFFSAYHHQRILSDHVPGKENLAADALLLLNQLFLRCASLPWHAVCEGWCKNWTTVVRKRKRKIGKTMHNKESTSTSTSSSDSELDIGTARQVYYQERGKVPGLYVRRVICSM